MRTFCIYCSELADRHRRAMEHMAKHCPEAQFINGIHAETFGIMAWRSYKLDSPTMGTLIPMAHTGLCLSHYMVWTICSVLPDEQFLVLEDDAEFSEGWREKMLAALKDCPADWDMLLIGSSNTFDKPHVKISETLFRVSYPMATHAYIIRRKALPVLLSVRDATMKIDVALIMKAYPKLNVYTVLPRLVGQHGTELWP